MKLIKELSNITSTKHKPLHIIGVATNTEEKTAKSLPQTFSAQINFTFQIFTLDSTDG